MGERPAGWMVLGKPGDNPLADGIRAQLASDPDKYAPETWSIDPVGVCPCCGDEVFRATTRHTNWDEGFLSHALRVHHKVNEAGVIDPTGGRVACCCVAPDFAPNHDAARREQDRREKKTKAKASRKKPAKRAYSPRKKRK
jgi:hypothetical protein